MNRSRIFYAGLIASAALIVSFSVASATDLPETVPEVMIARQPLADGICAAISAIPGTGSNGLNMPRWAIAIHATGLAVAEIRFMVI